MAIAIGRSAESGGDTDRLVERAKRRDPAAFEALYHAYHRRVLALTLRMSRDASRAESLTQDVFVQIWRALPGFRGDSAFGTWLHAIAVRVCLDANRSRRRRDERWVSVEDLDAYASSAKRAMPRTDVDLERALAGLPSRAREVVVLHDIYGYRHREIAEMLGIAEGTAKAHLHRARRLIRRALEGRRAGAMRERAGEGTGVNDGAIRMTEKRR